MPCPRCGSDVVAFVVPDHLLAHAPARDTAICMRCLTTHTAGDAAVDPASVSPESDPDLGAVDPAFPSGEAGVALALVCGLLESYALNRSAIESLLEHAERHGADVFAFLERLDAEEAAFDVERRRRVLLDSL